MKAWEFAGRVSCILYWKHTRYTIANGRSMTSPAALKAACLAANAERLGCGDLVWLEHINLVVGSREIAEAFYFNGLGFTKDSRKSSTTLWANVSRFQQLHLPIAAEGEAPHVVNGTVGITVCSLDRVVAGCAGIATALSGTEFVARPPLRLEDGSRSLVITGPWGNRFVMFEVGDYGTARAGAPTVSGATAAVPVMEKRHAEWDECDMAVRGGPGIRFIEFRSTSPEAAAAFYRGVFGARTTAISTPELAAVSVGQGCHFLFTATSAKAGSAAAASIDAGGALAAAERARIERQRGVHVCVYASNFEDAFAALHDAGLVRTNPRFAYLDRCDTLAEARASRQLRFYSVGSLELEHETRCLRHASYMRPLEFAG